MWPDRVSNPGPQTYESGALGGPAVYCGIIFFAVRLINFSIGSLIYYNLGSK